MATPTSGIRFGVVFALGLLLVTGCRTPSPRMLVSTTGTPLAIDDARAERALADYLDSVADRDGMRGSARVALSGPEFKLNRPQRIVVERPARLRFEILGLFDQLAAVLVTNGRQFGFFDASTGQISRGRVSPGLLWDLARIDLTPEEAVGLILGTPLPTPGIARAGVWLEPDGRVALAFAWPLDDSSSACQVEPERALFDRECFVEEAALVAGGEVFFFDAEGRLAEMRSLEAEGVIRFRVLFERYEALEGQGGVIFPKRVTIRSPGVESEARFDWKRVMLASDLSDRLFTLPERRNRRQGD